VNQLLAAASRAKLDVVGMNVEAKAVVDCFTHLYRRKTDADLTTCFVDIGASGTRAVIAKSGQILFARSIPIGGEHFNRAVANGLKISLEDARVLRIKLCGLQAQAAQAAQAAPEQQTQRRPAAAKRPADSETLEQAFPLLGAAMAASAGKSPRGATATAAAPAHARPAAGHVSYDGIGGEARHRGLCQHVARSMSLAAQVGDPLVRMGRTSDVGVESGIDRRQPQPSWCVAIGLSMGPVGGEKPAGAPDAKK